MRQLAAVLLAFALLTGATIFAERAGDRQCLVSPPDRTTEEFLREIETKRWSQARKYLTDEHVPEAQLRALKMKIGEPSEIHAELLAFDEHRARTRALGIEFRLVYDEGWRIEAP